MTLSRGGVFAILVVMSLALTGCLHQALPATVDSLDDAQVIGTWVHVEDERAISQLSFEADGVVKFDFPQEDLLELAGATEFVNAAWEIRETYDGRWEVVIFGEDAEGEDLHLNLGALDRPEGPVLFITLGDPDLADYYLFERLPES